MSTKTKTLNEEEVVQVVKYLSKSNPVYKKLASDLVTEKCLISDKIYVLDFTGKSESILEQYPRPEGLAFGLMTKRGYFTDPENHKIYASDNGFIFYVRDDKIFCISRESGETSETSYKCLETDEGIIDLTGKTPVMVTEDEVVWVKTEPELRQEAKIEKAQKILDKKKNEILSKIRK